MRVAAPLAGRAGAKAEATATHAAKIAERYIVSLRATKLATKIVFSLVYFLVQEEKQIHEHPATNGAAAGKMNTEQPPVADEGEDDEESGAKPAPEVVPCGVCSTGAAKYKCPRCFVQTCSLPCVKKHKEDSQCRCVLFFLPHSVAHAYYSRSRVRHMVHCRRACVRNTAACGAIAGV